MDFYERFEQEKSKKTFKIKDIAELLHKEYDTVRMAAKRKSFTELEKIIITERYFGNTKFQDPDIININEPEEQIPNKNGYITVLKNGLFRIWVKKVPVKAFGSYLSHYQDPDFLEEFETVSFPVDHNPKGNYIAFDVQGDSMNGGKIDDTKDGAELLCRELGRQHWRDGFRDSRLGWVIVHNDTVLFKDIKYFNSDTGDIVCSSRSGLPQHPDFTINLNDVRQIWKVIKRIQD
jgi:hypothetical protein